MGKLGLEMVKLWVLDYKNLLNMVFNQLSLLCRDFCFVFLNAVSPWKDKMSGNYALKTEEYLCVMFKNIVKLNMVQVFWKESYDDTW